MWRLSVQWSRNRSSWTISYLLGDIYEESQVVRLLPGKKGAILEAFLLISPQVRNWDERAFFTTDRRKRFPVIANLNTVLARDAVNTDRQLRSIPRNPSTV